MIDGVWMEKRGAALAEHGLKRNTVKRALTNETSVTG